MIRKSLLIMMAVALFPNLALAGRTLDYTDHEPLGGMRTQFIKDVFFPALEKESQGRLTVEGHWGGEIARSYDALRAVGKDGLADMAIVVPEYTPAELPLHQIFKSFPVGPSGDRQVAFFRRVYAEVPDFHEELAQQNVVVLLFATGFPVAFLSTGPLASLEDIRGGRWRSASFWHQDFLRNAGAEPVTMPWGDEVYHALQSGGLNGLMVNIDSGYDVRAHKAAPNILVSGDLWLGHVYLLVMNKTTWDGLAEEDRQAVRRAAETAHQALGRAMDAGFDAMLETVRAEGASVRILEPEEVLRWESATGYRDVQAAWVKKQEEQGLKNVARVMQRVAALQSEAGK